MVDQDKKKAMIYFGVAIVSGIIGFTALFVGNIDHAIAGGISLLGFLGFYVSFNKGYDRWLRKGAPGSPRRTNGR